MEIPIVFKISWELRVCGSNTHVIYFQKVIFRKQNSSCNDKYKSINFIFLWPKFTMSWYFEFCKIPSCKKLSLFTMGKPFTVYLSPTYKKLKRFSIFLGHPI